MTTKKTTTTATKATGARAAKPDAKATTKTATKPNPKTTTKAGTGAERLRKAAIAEIRERLAATEGERQDHEVPSDKEVANTANLRAAATANASDKAPKATKKPKATKAPTKAKPAKEPTPKRTSALDAAAIVLAGSAEPMGAKDLIGQMAQRGLWTSPGGKTPEATLYAAILREIGTRKAESRFAKVERGRFAATASVGRGA